MGTSNANEAALAYIGIQVSLRDGTVVQEGTFDTMGTFGTKSTKARDEKRKKLFGVCSTGEDVLSALRAMIPVVNKRTTIGGNTVDSFKDAFPGLCSALPNDITVNDIDGIQIVVRTFSEDFHAWKVDERFDDYFDAESLDIAYDDWLEHGWELSWKPGSEIAEFEKFGSVKNKYWN